jgi:hypothetical protein
MTPAMPATVVFRSATLSNPFATRFTRPGALPPLDTAGRPLDVPTLCEQALALGPLVTLEGPHGSGKSTLLIAIVSQAAMRGRPTALLRATSPGDAWRVATSLAAIPRGALVGLDGGERLPTGAFVVIRALARIRGLVVVATIHRLLWLPVLARCRTTPALLSAIVDRLPSHDGRIGRADVDDALARHSGDVREALFDLYDRFERRGG